MKKVLAFIKANKLAIIAGFIAGVIIMALLATGAPDIDYTPLGGDVVENDLSVE